MNHPYDEKRERCAHPYCNKIMPKGRDSHLPRKGRNIYLAPNKIWKWKRPIRFCRECLEPLYLGNHVKRVAKKKKED